MILAISVSFALMLDLRRLQTLRRVVATSSFSAAALELGYTQSSVSQQIAALEAQLGVTLIDRARRPIGPTAAGERVLARAEVLLGQAAALEGELAELGRGDAGTLRLAGFFTAWTTFLPSAIARYAKDHPAVRLELAQLEPEPAVRGVVAGELDLAVVYGYPGEPPPDGLVATALVDDPYAVAMPVRHRLARGDDVALGDLAGERWVLSGAATGYGALVRQMCADAGFQPDVALETGDIAMVQPLVAAGLAVSLMPALGLSPRHAGVAVRPLRERPLARRVVAVRSAHLRVPTAVAMTETLVRAVSERSVRRGGSPAAGPSS